MDWNQRGKTKKLLLLTGGHFSPALAVIEELEKRKDWEVVVIGRAVSQEGSTIPARELLEMRSSGIKVITIPAGKIPRHFEGWGTIAPLLKIPLGFLSALWHVKRLQPDVILTFGGYVALPVALAGKVSRIPLITHEQTATKGLANSIIERLADRVAISWEESLKMFSGKTVTTGNPLRQAIIQGQEKPVPIERNSRPLLYVTGGNQGSHVLNTVIERALPQILRHYALIHQCGTTRNGQDLARLLEIRSFLSKKLQRFYYLRDWFSAPEVNWVLTHCDLVIGRSGANTVTELIWKRKMSLLVPLPHAGANEQMENALLMQAEGLAEIIPQKDLTPESLLKKVEEMLNNPQGYLGKSESAKMRLIEEAPARLVELIDREYEKACKGR